MEQAELKKWKEVGRAAVSTLNFAKKLVKPQVPLLEIAEQVEEKIAKEKVKVNFAFPINLSLNAVAAHCSPAHNDTAKAEGLVKIDLGLCVDGRISDCACSVDLTPEQQYKDLIRATNDALQAAIKTAKAGVAVRKIGAAIHSAITALNFSPIRNLSGHELLPYELHAGLTIPNYDNRNEEKLKEGQIIAIEPFATSGVGLVQDSKPGGIYRLIAKRPVRDAATRQLLDFIINEYRTLPFSARWLVKRFGLRSLFSLRLLEQAEVLHQFAQLVEASKAPVSQAESTILIKEHKAAVLTIEE